MGHPKHSADPRTPSQLFIRRAVAVAIPVMMVIGLAATPATAIHEKPGAPVALKEASRLPNPYSMGDSDGDFTVLTVRRSEISVLEQWAMKALGKGENLTTAAAPADPAPKVSTRTARQNSLNAAMQYTTSDDDVLLVNDRGSTSIPEGSRVLAINHQAPKAGPAPAGTWLIVTPEAAFETLEVDTNDVALTAAPAATPDEDGLLTPSVSAVATPAFSLGDVTGPSSGLGLTLAWIDALTDGDLTGGKQVAATGTITPEGLVGEVGGISHKLVAAQEAGAELTLIPDTYEGPIPVGLNVQKVSTLIEALNAMADTP